MNYERAEYIERILSVLVEKAGGAVEITEEDLRNAKKLYIDRDIFRDSTQMAIEGAADVVSRIRQRERGESEVGGEGARELLLDES